MAKAAPKDHSQTKPDRLQAPARKPGRGAKSGEPIAVSHQEGWLGPGADPAEGKR
jgi:hypothetical protein